MGWRTFRLSNHKVLGKSSCWLKCVGAWPDVDCRLQPIHGASGGAKVDTSRSFAATMNAASRATFFHPSPMFTMESQTNVSWNALEGKPAGNHKLIKFPTWYSVVQCNWKHVQSKCLLPNAKVCAKDDETIYQDYSNSLDRWFTK